MNPLAPERFMIDDTLIEKDYDYMHRLIPDTVRSIFEHVEDACDRLEYAGSFLYDECPDKTTLYDLTNKIYNTLSSSETPALKDLILTMLCDEILYRRYRYYRKKKLFEQ